jgi:uncharacterized protein YtpQ (UPF0354 family)
MTQNPILRARIDGGRVLWQGLDGKRWETLKRFLDKEEVDISIGRRRKKSSRKQRQYYWPVIVAMIAEAAGYEATPENLHLVHDGLRARFLTVPQEDSNGSILPVIRSTESLTTTQREVYHEQCRQFGAEYYGIYIPDPNEVVEDSQVISK